MQAYDGMPLLGDAGGAFAGMRLDDAIERKMDLLLGSHSEREASIEALNKGIAEAFATSVAVSQIEGFFAARERAMGGLDIGMRTARDTILDRIGGSSTIWSGADLIMYGMHSWAFGGISTVLGADAWMRISAGSFVEALPQVEMSKDAGYVLPVAVGEVDNLGDLLPLRAVGVEIGARRDALRPDWRRSAADIKRRMERRLIDGMHKSILYERRGGWDGKEGDNAAILGGASAEADMARGVMRIERGGWNDSWAAFAKSFEPWGEIEAGDLFALCHWSEKDAVEKRLGIKTYAPRVVAYGLGYDESEDIVAVIALRRAFRFGLRGLPWIRMVELSEGKFAIRAALSFGFGGAGLEDQYAWR